MANSTSPGGQSGKAPELLGIYLNDHLAAATGGVQLFRRTAGALRGTPAGNTLGGLVAQIAEDRYELLEIMRSLGVPVRRYKVYAGWAAEKMGRLKPNGQLTGRSALSNVLELESLFVGVQGKAALWRSLRALADNDRRLVGPRLDDLIERAGRQADTLEGLRATAAREAFEH